MDVREFLEGFTADELVGLGVLNPYGSRHLLQGDCVQPLLDLMSVRGVTRLESANWYLAANGDFFNPWSLGIRSGNISQLGGWGNVFKGQNTSINPFFPPD